MAGLLSAMSAVSLIVDKVSKGGDSKSIAASLLDSRKEIKLATTNGSITKLLSKYIVSPIIICTNTAQEIEIFDKVNELNCDVFASFYMQAFQILTNEYNLDSTMAVDLLSTDQISFGSNYDKVIKVLNGEENSSYRTLMNNGLYLTTTVSKEEDDGDDEYKGTKLNNIKSSGEKDPTNIILQRNLTVTYHVKNAESKVEHTIVIPIIIKAHIIITSIESILNLLTPTSKNKSFWNRLDDYRAGSIGLKELIFCGDLIKEYKNVKRKDKDKLFNILHDRSTLNAVNLLTNSPTQGFGAKYNMLVITSDDKSRIDKYIGGDILKENNKQKLLDDINGISVSILDPDYERLQMLISDIRGTTDIGFKTLAKRKSKDSSELGDIFKSMMLNKPIGF